MRRARRDLLPERGGARGQTHRLGRGRRQTRTADADCVGAGLATAGEGGAVGVHRGLVGRINTRLSKCATARLTKQAVH